MYPWETCRLQAPDVEIIRWNVAGSVSVGYFRPMQAKPRKLYTPTYLAAWRELAGFNQSELADITGYSRVHVGNVERGIRPYTQEFLEACVAALRSQFPALTEADIVGVDPRKLEAASLALLALKIPQNRQESAGRMLLALAEEAVAESIGRSGRKPRKPA